MYVCNCNGLRESDVKAAAANGIQKPSQVYGYNGCAAQCGKCVSDINAVLKSCQQRSRASVSNAA